MDEEPITRPEPPCGLPKQGNNCANKSTLFCAKCGWNPEEQARRKALPLTKNEAGLLHKDIGNKIGNQPGYIFILSGLLPLPLRHETAAGGLPRLCTPPAGWINRRRN